MSNRCHRIEVYEPFEYDGPNPLLVVGRGLLVTPDKKDAYLLDLHAPLNIDGKTYKQIIIRPRYPDPIERVTASTCTVLILLVKEGVSPEVGDQFQYNDILNWGIGKISPQKNGSD
ncbi:MAG: hypothetical protein R3188_03090 [Acidiferrobacterales bacterium]|nr:hypothetical protein [Acidiferrobacterales bacterium]